MAVKTADQAFNAWKAAMASGQTSANYIAGVKRVQQSPMAAAATPEAQARYVQNTAAASQSGKMANALNAVSLSSWQNQAATVGAPRLASGATKGGPKMQAACQKNAGIWAQQQAAVANMPKGGLANATARVQAAMQIAMQAAGTA